MVEPVHGAISIPAWLDEIKDRPIVRRMINIRQLGLKAYINFPGAIHTRYLHSLGVMHLARQLVDLLLDSDVNTNAKDYLKSNRLAIEIAGFLHDVGHGPYSHLLDYPMQTVLDKSHEDVTIEVIESMDSVIEDTGCSKEQVKKIVKAESSYPYIHEIVNGQIDVDKLDYMLRDAYHTGLRYGFDLRFFLKEMTIVGKGSLENLHLGMRKTDEGIAWTETFLLNWRTLYTVLYYARPARIAEKMLEKAILKALEDKEFRQDLDDVERFSKIDEAGLRTKLEDQGGIPEELANRVWLNKIYEDRIDDNLLKWLLDEQEFDLDEPFLSHVIKSSENVSETLTKILSDEVGEEYSVICDIVSSRIPKKVRVEDKSNKEGYVSVDDVSPVVRAIQSQQRTIMIYYNPDITLPSAFHRKGEIKKRIQEEITDWQN